MKNTNKKTYFTLLERYKGTWYPEAGSYDKSDMMDEADYITSGSTKKSDLKIITTDDKQESIDKAVNELNNITKG